MLEVLIVLVCCVLLVGAVGFAIVWIDDYRERNWKITYSIGGHTLYVYVQTSKWNPTYPTLSKKWHEYVGSVLVSDEEGVSDLMIKAAQRRDELRNPEIDVDAAANTAYIQAVYQAVNRKEKRHA